jgi:hypothetical protein
MAARRQPAVFRYKPVAGVPSPVAAAGLFVAGKWTAVEFYVDSGATYTVMPAQYAVDFGLDWRSGRRVHLQVGDGGLIPVFLHTLPMQIGATRFDATVGFSEKLGVRFNLLGRQGVFEHFKICFHERRRVLSFQPVN